MEIFSAPKTVNFLVAEKMLHIFNWLDDEIKHSPCEFDLTFFGFWLIGLKSQWAYLIINHKLCTICGHIQMEHMEGDIPYPYLPLPTLPLPLPVPTHPYPYLPPTHPYPLPPPTSTTPLPPPTSTTPYHHPPLLPPTTTHPYYSPTTTPPLLPPTTTHPTTNNGLERSQVIGNVQMWSRRWIQTPPPLLTLTPTTPYPHPPLLQIMVLKDANL